MNYFKKNSITICYRIGIIQGISLAVYTIWAATSAFVTRDIERIDTFITENIVYLIFIILIILVAKGFQKLKRFAYTPFLLIQLFAIIIGWPFLEAPSLIAKLFGLILISVSILALILGLIPFNRHKFYKNNS
ncbi:MAG: hypothetical protein FJW84_01385 [Actinobacteria bacterium]|nr:hypothetical protein [Actinomycetota bacterium]